MKQKEYDWPSLQKGNLYTTPVGVAKFKGRKDGRVVFERDGEYSFPYNCGLSPLFRTGVYYRIQGEHSDPLEYRGFSELEQLHTFGSCRYNSDWLYVEWSRDLIAEDDPDIHAWENSSHISGSELRQLTEALGIGADASFETVLGEVRLLAEGTNEKTRLLADEVQRWKDKADYYMHNSHRLRDYLGESERQLQISKRTLDRYELILHRKGWFI